MKSEIVELEVPLKKTRAVLSAVDLFHSSWSYLHNQAPATALGDIQLEIRRPMSHMPKAVLLTSSQLQPEADAILQFRRGSERLAMALFEGERVPHRTYTFDEQLVFKACRGEGKTVTLSSEANLDLTPVQIYASMSKLAFKNVSPSRNADDLVLARIELSEYGALESQREIEVSIHLSTAMPYNLTHIRVAGVSIGRMFWKVNASDENRN